MTSSKQLRLVAYIVLLGWIQYPTNAKPNVVIVLTDDQGISFQDLISSFRKKLLL